MSTRRGQLVELARVITASPALLTREQQIFARLTDSLAQLIAEDTGEASGAVETWVAANAHMGAHRGLVAHMRRLILAGARDDARDSGNPRRSRPRPRPARLKAYAVRA